MAGFKAWMTFSNEPPATNACVFATAEEAAEYGKELTSRWFVPTGYEVRPTDEAPNYSIDLRTWVLTRLPDPKDTRT